MQKISPIHFHNAWNAFKANIMNHPIGASSNNAIARVWDEKEITLPNLPQMQIQSAAKHTPKIAETIRCPNCFGRNSKRSIRCVVNDCKAFLKSQNCLNCAGPLHNAWCEECEQLCLEENWTCSSCKTVNYEVGICRGCGDPHPKLQKPS